MQEQYTVYNKGRMAVNKEETLEIKGLAIILMFWHHLIGCGSFLFLTENQTWVPCFGSYDVILGEGSKVCIALFAAASGYGLYKSYIGSPSVKGLSAIGKRAGTFLITYWTMFLIAMPYLAIFGKFHPEWIPVNLFALLHNDEMLYLSFSWYVKVYIEILLVLPLVKYLDSRIHSLCTDIVLFIVLPVYLCGFLPDAESQFIGWDTNILSSIRLLLLWYPAFHAGALLAKYKVIEKLSKRYGQASRVSIVFAVVAVLILIEYWRRRFFGGYTDALCVAGIILLVDFCHKNAKWDGPSKLLKFLGKYSFQYWLLSGMFFLNTTEFQFLLVLPKYSVLILPWSFLLITPFVILMSKISDLICAAVLRRPASAAGT